MSLRRSPSIPAAPEDGDTLLRAAADEKEGVTNKVWLEGADVEDLNAFFSRAANALLDGLRRECQRKLNEHRDRLRAQYDEAVKRAEERAKERAAKFVETFRAPAGSAVAAARSLPAQGAAGGSDAADGAAADAGAGDCGGGAVDQAQRGAAEALRLEQLLREARAAGRPTLDHQGQLPFSPITSKALHDCLESCKELRKYCEQVSERLAMEVVVQTLSGEEYVVTVRPAAENASALSDRLARRHHLKHFRLFTQSGLKLRSHDPLKDYDLESGLILAFEALSRR